MANRRRTWPYNAQDAQRNPPVAWFLAPGVWERSDRSLVGPLRHGTTPGSGPRGGAVVADYTERSDMGTDRISPRDFDPMGTARRRFGDIPSNLIAREIRGDRGR